MSLIQLTAPCLVSYSDFHSGLKVAQGDLADQFGYIRRRVTGVEHQSLAS